MKKTLVFLPLIILLVMHIWLSNKVVKNIETLNENFDNKVVISGKMLKLSALEFRGLVADTKVFSAIMYLGKLFYEQKHFNDNDWDWFYATLSAASELDPYFFDTYYFGSFMLAWEAKRPHEALSLLSQGIKHRPNDYKLMFIAGFIYYEQLEDRKKSAEYITRAARIKGAPTYYATLAARLEHDSGHYSTAAVFLVEMINQTENEDIKKVYEKRLIALEKAILLENAVKIYTEKFKIVPKTLNELTENEIIDSIPEDPYGGSYFIDDNGTIKTTSNFRENKT